MRFGNLIGMGQLVYSYEVWRRSPFFGQRGFHLTNLKSHTPFDPRGVGGYKKKLMKIMRELGLKVEAVVVTSRSIP